VERRATEAWHDRINVERNVLKLLRLRKSLQAIQSLGAFKIGKIKKEPKNKFVEAKGSQDGWPALLPTEDR